MSMKKKNWWETNFKEIYFDAFDKFYSAKRGEAEAEFLVRTLRMKKGNRVLDLACGQGRHVISLAKRGMNVVGVDASAYLLEIAKQRAKEAKVDVNFLREDMRAYYKNEEYDTILILGNSFGYFDDEDNERVLSNVARSLKIGGRFVLDLPNTPGMLRRNIVGRWTQKIENGTLTTSTLQFDPQTFKATMQWNVWQRNKNTVLDGFFRLYTPPEIRSLLANRNLRIEETFGSFSHEPYNIKTKRYLLIAQKLA